MYPPEGPRPPSLEEIQEASAVATAQRGQQAGDGAWLAQRARDSFPAWAHSRDPAAVPQMMRKEKEQR